MSKKLAFVLVFAFAILPLAANALGLGEIKLNSSLNQPFSADIPVVGAASDEVNSLHVKVASAQQFQQAGIPMADALNQLQFQVMQGPNATAYVHISSSQPFREPFVDVLVDATWDNGELIREYTVFLNPSSFESAVPAAPSPAPAQPAASAPVGTAAPAPPPAAPVAAPAVQPQSTPPTIAPVVSAGNAALGGNYGPIHRGETLSEIALRMRPQGVTLNQMMIAIYRANPEVFMHNINLMKAGYVLRIPTADDLQEVKVAEANSEVRTQIAEWRSSRGLATANKIPSASNAEQPSLQLVAPSSAAQTAENQVPGAVTGTGAAAGTKTTAAASNTAAATVAAPVSTTTSHAPIAIANSSLAAVQGQASKENKPAAQSKVTPFVPEKPAVAKPFPKRVITPVQPAASGSLLGSLTNPIIIILIIVVIVLIIIGVIVKNRRAGSTPVGGNPIRSKTKAPVAESADWGNEEKAGLKDVTANNAAGTRGKSGQAAGAAAATAPGVTTTLKLDETDPIAEADFHMAYGLYDQAASVLKKALNQDPGRRDLKMKLLEVYFTAGDRANFVEIARGLRQEMGALPDKDWENIAIMGRQVAADEPLFSGDAAVGTAGSSIDIPLDSGGTGTAVGTDLDPLAGAFEGVRAVTLPESSRPTPSADSHVVDFSLPDIEPTPAKGKGASRPASAQPAAVTMEPPAPARKPAAKVGVSTVTADFGTDSQVEFDKALKELSDFVNTNVPPQEEGAHGGAATTGATLSLAADADMVGTSIGTGSGTNVGEETTGLNEIGTKLDLARAYIDMGDADGAKNILQEVMEEGDSQQKQEAQKLMQHLA
ncbi:MAG: FimV/HubP family polar landmark protein [Gammaproteobacteria bacterium]